VAAGDHVVFALELLRANLERLLSVDRAAALQAAQPEISLLGKILGAGETVFLRPHPAVFAGKVGRSLPVAAVVAATDMDLSAHDGVMIGHDMDLARRSSKCVTVV
jgi:hypothetical protein